ncbi:DUF3304 domain-containing protein [Xanthomonas massiliensis]|uniref:DUF3304 domain-containing protein n=1 Tax=Xanthomonas massiliensis TaxID=1720302 RepID=UPI00098EEC36|nr:DUF3304 domain-containing protein [Xanthomonas massiliensis]
MIDHEGECRRTIRWLLLSLLVVVGGGCKAQEEKIGVGITGLDHLADHLSVQEFSVDGYRAGRAGGGGGTVCCAMLPAKWRPGLSVRVDWLEQNWRDCSYRERHRQVPVERYDEIGTLWVHFLTNGNVRVIVSNPGPGNPDYPGPHDPIPRKNPWHVYPADAHCNKQWTEVKEP